MPPSKVTVAVAVFKRMVIIKGRLAGNSQTTNDSVKWSPTNGRVLRTDFCDGQAGTAHRYVAAMVPAVNTAPTDQSTVTYNAALMVFIYLVCDGNQPTLNR